MRRDGCSDACAAMLGGGGAGVGGVGGKVGPFGSDMQLGRAKQQQQQQQQASSGRVHFSSPVGYKSFNKDLNRFNVFNNNNMTLEGANERMHMRSTTDNR